MNTLEYRLKDPTYKNWVKTGLCLALVKEGLEEYADIKSNEFHDAVLASVAKITTLQTSVCDNERISFDNNNRGKITCRHAFCQGFLDAIFHLGIDPNPKFTIRKANIDNCNVKLWHTDHWELAKLFMNPGQTSGQTKPSQTDLSGLLNFLERCAIHKNGIHNAKNIEKVRLTRNSVMHTPDMKVSQVKFQIHTQTMLDLLQDPKFLLRLPSAKHAAAKIQKVKQSDFQITLEDEIGIMKKFVTDLQKITEELRNAFRGMQHVNEEEKKHLQSRMQQMEEDIKEVACSVTTLTKLVSDDKTLKERIGQEIKNLHDSLEQANADLWSAHNDEKRRLAELEQKHVESDLKTSAIIEDVSAHDVRITNIEYQLEAKTTPAIGDEDCRKFRENLVEEYSRIYKDISLSPLGDGLNDEALRVPIDKIYSDLDIVKIKGNKQSELESENVPDTELFPYPLLFKKILELEGIKFKHRPLVDRDRKKQLKSYSEMFSDKEIKNIVIKGEGGTGKSTWCKRLLHAWCQVQRRVLGMEGAKSGDEANTDMEESLKRFDYLLYVTLRHVKHQSSLKDTIFSACLERLSMQKNVCELILANYSEYVLILLDGFDEYPFTLDCEGLGQSTIVMTTRPWKYDKLLETYNKFKVDAVSEIRGLTDQGVKELSKKVIASYNKQYSDMGSDSSNEEEQTSKFLRDTRSAELSNSIRIPLILIITALTWLENKSLSKSLTYNILGLLKVIFKRGENKLLPNDKAALKRVELEKKGTSLFHKCLTEKYKFMRDNQILLQHLGRLAYKGLTDQKGGLSLVFTKDALHEFLDPDELESCYKLGLLTGSAVTTSLLEPRQVSISFYHKLIQELFAAISIISDSDNTLAEFTKILASLTAVSEMENVILFITGLNPSIGSDLSKHFVGLADTDDSIGLYRSGGLVARLDKLMFKCMLEWDIVHERKEQKRLCLTDLIITSNFDNKLRLCTYHNREHLKSLKVEVGSSESVSIIPILSQLTTLTNKAVSLISLEINVEEVRCEGITTKDTTHFDLTSNVHLENVSIQGIRLSKMQHFLSVTFGKTMQLRRVKIENAVINTLYLENNTELELKDVKVSEIRLPSRLEQLQHVSLQSVTMPVSSWNSFFQSLQSPSLTNLRLKNLNIDDRTIILENSSALKNLELEDVKVSEIRLPTRLEQLKDVSLQSVTMPVSSWNRVFQSLQSPSLTWLTLKNLNTDDITIILENCSGLTWLRLEDVKVSRIRLPARLEQLQHVSLQSVTMPGSSWNRVFQSLQSPSLTNLRLKNLNIDDRTIILENSSALKNLELENVKVSEIRLPTRLEQLKDVSLQSVTMPVSSWNRVFQSLQSPSLTWLTLKNLNTDDITIILENCSGLTWLKLEDVKVSRIRLPARLEQLMFVTLLSVTMPGSSWNSVFQTLQSASLTWLTLKKPNIDDMTIILENCSGLKNLELEDVKVSEIRLPTRLEQLKDVSLQSVTMPVSSWNSVHQSLQSASLTELTLKNPNIDDITIILENCSGLEILKLEDVKVSEIRLPTRLEQLQHVSLQSVTMPGSSWNRVFQSLQSPSLTWLTLKNLNTDDITIILENCSGLTWLKLEDVKVSKIRLPTRLEQLQHVSLQSVTMPGSSWNRVFQSLQSPSLTWLTLKNLNTDDITIILENCSGLTWLRLEDVKVSKIRLPTRLEQLQHVILQSVTMPGSSWNSAFQTLLSASLTWLTLKNPNIDDMTIILENCSGLEILKLEDVKVSEIRLPTRLEQLKDVSLKCVTMTVSSWNNVHQSLQSASLTELTLKNPNIDDITIILENCSGLEILKLEDVKVSEIRLPTRLEQLQHVSLQSVTMPGSSWNRVFQSLQSPSLTWLTLKNPNIDDLTIILENYSGLRWLRLEDVKVSEIRLPTRLEQLKDVSLQSVTMPVSSWNSFFQSLQSPSLTELTLKNPNIDDITIILENYSGLKKLELKDVKVSEIRLPSRLEQLKDVSLQSVTMPGSSWNRVFQSLQSPSLTNLRLKNLNIDDRTIILENSSALKNLELEDVKVSEIRLPTRLEQLQHVSLQSVTMPGSSWNRVFQSLQSASLTELILKNLNIDDIFIRLFNCEELEQIEISNVKLAGIEISSTERLGTVKVDEVVFPESRASSFFNQFLQSTALVQLTMRNISLGEETVRFDSWHCESWHCKEAAGFDSDKGHTVQIQLENVSMSQESYKCLCTLLKTLKCSENQVTTQSLGKGLLNVTVVQTVYF